MQLKTRYLRATVDEVTKQPFSAELEVKNLMQVGNLVEPCLVLRAMQPGVIGMLNMVLDVMRNTDYPFEAQKEFTQLIEQAREFQRGTGTVAPPVEYLHVTDERVKVQGGAVPATSTEPPKHPEGPLADHQSNVAQVPPQQGGAYRPNKKKKKGRK